MTIEEKLHSLSGEDLARALMRFAKCSDDCLYAADGDKDWCYDDGCQMCIDRVKAWLKGEYKDNCDFDMKEEN